MADNTQNPNLGGNTGAARDQLDLSRQVRREAGDYRDYLKESEALLKKMVRSYETIEGQIGSLNRSTINIKEINKIIQRGKEQDLNIQKKINEFEKDTNATRSAGFNQYKQNLNNIKGLEEDIIQAKKDGNLINLRAAQDLLEEQIQLRDNQFQLLNIEEQSYANNLKSQELSKEKLDYAQKQLEAEKNIAKEVGLTGSLLKLAGKFYPKAGELYGKVVEEARDGVKTTSNLVKGFTLLGAALVGVYKLAVKAFNAISQGITSLTGSGGPLSKFVSPFTDLIKQIPFVGGLIGSIVDLGANLLDFATGANSEIQKFARNLGMSVDDAKKLNDEYDSIARNSGSAYLNAEKFRKAQTELSAALGINNEFSKQILDADIRLAEQAGIELDTRKELAAVAGIQRTDQIKIFQTVQAQTKFLSSQLGINIRLQDTIKKAASFGGILGLTFAKYPEKLTKALLVTKALGMDLQKIDGIAGGLLDFESSIAKEFEAQLLTGKDINLQKAREYALNNDLLGVANEVNKVVGSTEEFLNMNRLQQESIAESIGMSRDELADVLKQQALFAAAGAKTEKQFKENIKLMEQRGTLESEFLSKLSDTESQLFLNSTATEKIANFMDKLKQSFANLLNNPGFQDFVNTIMTKLMDPNFINDIINKLTSFVSLILRAVAGIVDAADVAARVLSFGTVDIDNKIPDSIKKMANELGSVSLGTNVARSQAGFSGANVSSTGAGNAGRQNMNVNVEAYLVHNAKMAKVTYDESTSVEQGTGPFNKPH